MTFRYFAVSKPKERDRPRGLFAVNRDRQAGRLDTLSYDHLEGRWVFDPGITRYLFKEDYIEDATEISREQAQQVARDLGIPLPSEDEMMALTDEAEQQAALLQGDGLDEGSTS